jgi:hypothetical protein
MNDKKMIRWHNSPPSQDALQVRWGAKWVGWLTPTDAQELAGKAKYLYFQNTRKKVVKIHPYLKSINTISK